MIKLFESKIRAIRAKSAGHGAHKDVVSASGGEVRSLQEKMMSDKGILSLVQSLQNNPKFQRILQDPEVMEP